MARSRESAAAVQAAERRSRHGIVVRNHARNAGLSDDAIQRLVGRGRWRRMFRGIYAIGEPTALGRAYATTVALGRSNGVGSHWTAARAHGLDVIDVRAELTGETATVDRDLRRPFVAGLHVFAHDLAPSDRAVLAGVPITELHRTVVDLLLRGPKATSIWATEQAIAAARVSRARIDGMLAGSRHVPGVVAARRRLALVDPRSESPLETLARLVIVDAGLPAPDVQIPVLDPSTGRLWFRIDLGYAGKRIAIECDGRGPHGSPEAVFADRRRQNQLHLLGWTVLRLTWYDVVHRPAYVVWLVRSALAVVA